MNIKERFDAEARERNERSDALLRLHSRGYREYICQVTGISYWSQTENGDRITDENGDICTEGDPRKVLESLLWFTDF